MLLKVRTGPEGRASTLQRLLLLCLCVGAGSAIGLAGRYFTGSVAWFLAVPALVLLAWLFVANPAECDPPRRPPPQ